MSHISEIKEPFVSQIPEPIFDEATGLYVLPEGDMWRILKSEEGSSLQIVRISDEKIFEFPDLSFSERKGEVFETVMAGRDLSKFNDGLHSLREIMYEMVYSEKMKETLKADNAKLREQITVIK